MKVDFAKNLAAGLGVTIVFFVSVELILMAIGVTPLYKRTDPSVGFSGYAPLFHKHDQPNGESIYRTAHNKYEWFNMQSFPVRKAEGVTRIFCVGGSTTYGRPYDDRTSFCGWLRQFLPEVDPNRHWEVVNAGGISYASYRAARLMEELANYEPDLFIVYSGHNEFLESRTYRELRDVPKFVRNAGVLASRTRLYSVLYDLAYKRKTILPTEVDALLDRSIGPDDYQRDDELRNAVLSDFKNSLVRMTKISKQTQSDIILITPASNISDFSPFKSEPGPDLSATEINKIDTLKGMVIKALHSHDYVYAESIARKARALDDRNAEILYLHGKALDGLDRIDEAQRAFIRSRDEDVCPLRALTPIREIVTDVARTQKTGFVDFVSIVREHSPDGIPGSEMFLDHVHPTIEGNRLLALAIIEEMDKEGMLTKATTWNEDKITELTADLENSLDERNHAMALRNLSKVLSWAGKHDEAERLINEAVATIPDDGETNVQKGRLLWIAGEREAALIHYQEAARLEPLNARTPRGIGILLSELGRPEEALLELEEAIRLDPNLEHVYYDLGIVLQALGSVKQAEEAYRAAQKQDPNHAEAYNNMGILFAKQGNLKAALEQFSEALRIDPDNKDAAANLARAKKALDL